MVGKGLLVMKTEKIKKAALRRKYHVRKKVFGMPDRPRLTVFRSNRHIYAQIIDDVAGATFAGFANYLVPIVGVFLGVFFLQDYLPLSAYFSILIIALALFAGEWRPARFDSVD